MTGVAIGFIVGAISGWIAQNLWTQQKARKSSEDVQKKLDLNKLNK